ncbi:MAG TPA: outer membrane beta-barrel protein [Flavobacterium sp.]|nr:outer membrane beta-barrel protein [Flavobacterium sp.]
MHGLYRKEIILTLFLTIALPAMALAQLNFQHFDEKKLYFGISLGFNTSKFRVVHSDAFTYHDTVAVLNSKGGPGFNLGIISNLKLGKYFDVRFIPTLVFAEKNLNYTMFDNSEARKSIESIFIDFPVSVRFKSQPIKDVRIYVLAGMKYGLDLASNAKARRAEDQVKVSRTDISAEYGIGVQFFFPLFIFSPEIKFSQGLFDVHSKDSNLMFSNVIEKLFTRSLIISLHFEG